jgi:signal transduction histidine kinase/ligand-binding sensor domain-containing protein
MKKRPILKQFAGLIIAMLLLAKMQAFAQLNASNLTQYTEAEGLPSAEVHQIIADKLGYIWVGTINGLARFDGYSFKRFYFNPNDTLTIHGLDVESLFEDRTGQIWVGSIPSFLNCYSPLSASFRQYDFSKLIAHAANVELDVEAICEDDNGRIYFGVDTYRSETINSALLYKDKNEDQLKQFASPDSLPIQNVYSMTRDKSGNIWFLSHSGLFKIDFRGNLSKIHNASAGLLIQNGEHPTAIKADKYGALWITSSKARLYRFDSDFRTYKTFIPPGNLNNFFSALVFDKEENVWISSYNGLVKFDRKKEKFEVFDKETPKKLEKAPILNALFDSFGTLWIASPTRGLLKYEERTIFNSYSNAIEDKSTITPGWANKVYETSDGIVWTATSGMANIPGGLNQLDPRTGILRSSPFSSILSGTWLINGLYENNPGELILNTNLGNWLLDRKTNSLKKYVFNGVPDSVHILQFYKDSKENFWLCTLSGLFKREKDAEIFKRYDLSGLPGGNAVSNEVTALAESPKHGLWLATNNGLYLYNYATDKIERHGFDPKKGDIFLTQDVNSLYEDPDGRLWTGTWEGGLSVYNVETKQIKTYTQNDGLPSMSIQGILADEKNNALWLSTFDGISRMDLKTKQFNNFSSADGMQSQLYADGACLKTQNGLFVFGGSNGITVFDPNEINKESTPPKVFLTDLKLFDKSVRPGDHSILKAPIYDIKEITLDHDQNNISLEFIAIHYSDPSLNIYRYKMENYDNEWREIGNQHSAFYPKLPPGKYVFRVKAANNHGIWNEEGATLRITVNPPWWETIWAYILYGLLLVALVFALDRYFRGVLVRKERERNQVRELAQAREIEKAYTELKSTQAQLIQSEKMASLGELTAGIAHEIQNPLNFVNNFSEINKELIDELQAEIDKGNLNDAKAISVAVKENESKINHHGKRADAIVKSMMQHSRSNAGQREPTDLNALADEYLRLSYHGLRAKDITFNAKMRTDFDPRVELVRLIPQEIGRVLLNLYNNAFYAVAEKEKQMTDGYEPEVTVRTKRYSDNIEIRVEDNGNGIPEKAIDKIFQPFFTTKPTGVGTGLGLSLSYDIIKAHGGEIKVETKLGEGTAFVVQLSLS